MTAATFNSMTLCWEWYDGTTLPAEVVDGVAHDGMLSLGAILWLQLFREEQRKDNAPLHH